MKQILLILILFITFFGYAQEQSEPVEKRNEVYLNAFNLVAFKWFDVSYEYLINEESSVGISLLTSLNKESNFDSPLRNYSITPY